MAPSNESTSFLLLVLALVASLSSSLDAAIIDAYAGDADGTSGLSGDGGAATSAMLFTPQSLVYDANGNLVICDSGNHRIQLVDASTGNITTIAGSAAGTPGSSGNGGAATSALLHSPKSVALDASGNLFIADGGNNRIQLVNASTGIITTFAGSAGGSNGHTGNGGAATSALLKSAFGVAVSPDGNVAIADSANNRIQLVNSSSGIITTYAGDATGASHGITGNGGPATSALLYSPTQIAFDGAGNLAISDLSNCRVQLVDASTGVITVSGLTSDRCRFPFRPAERVMRVIFVTAEINTHTRTPLFAIHRPQTAAGSATGACGSTGIGGPATLALISFPYGVAFSPTTGNMVFSDYVSPYKPY